VTMLAKAPSSVICNQLLMIAASRIPRSTSPVAVKAPNYLVFTPVRVGGLGRTWRSCQPQPRTIGSVWPGSARSAPMIRRVLEALTIPPASGRGSNTAWRKFLHVRVSTMLSPLISPT
jgi:hypothetical protein